MRKFLEKLNKEKGITLIALVITVVILIILSTVSINALFGDNGLVKYVESAKKITEDKQIDEGVQFIVLSARTENKELDPDKFKSTIENNLTEGFIFDGANIITHKATDKKYYISEEYNILSTISTKEDLMNIKQNGNYILVNDIDLSGMEWKPIPMFSGTLDGNNHAINGLTINASASNNQALFSVINNGKIKNLALTNVDISAMISAGGIVGSSDEGSSTITIENCYSTSEISAHSPYSGSIIGYNVSNQIKNCYGISPSISGSYIGRIFGTPSIKGQNNYGYVGTLINGSIISNSDVTSNNGADIDLSNLTNQTHYSTVGGWNFDDNGFWTFNYSTVKVEDGTNLPVLKSFTDIVQNPKV